MKKYGKETKKLECDVCGEVHKTKKALIECLSVHLEDADCTTDIVTSQLEELGIENPYSII